MVAKPTNTIENKWDKGPDSLTNGNTAYLSEEVWPKAADSPPVEGNINIIELAAGVLTSLIGTIGTDLREEKEHNEKFALLKAAQNAAAIQETSNQIYNFSQRNYSNANGDVFGDTVFTDEEGLLIDEDGNYLSHDQLTQIGDNDGVCYGFKTIDGELTNDMLEYFAMDYEVGMEIDQTQIPEHIQTMVADIENPTVEDYENAAHDHLSLGATDKATILDVSKSQISAYFTDHANLTKLVADKPTPTAPIEPAFDNLNLD